MWRRNILDRSRFITIIPAYNEEMIIGNVINRALPFSNVLVVNDGSSDETEIKAEKAGAEVITNSANLGYVKSLNNGLSWATKRKIKYAIFMDADGEHSPKLIKTFIHEIEKSEPDIIFGIRTRYARLSEKLFGLFFAKLFGVYDPLCGMKCINIKLWDVYGPMKYSYTFGIDMYLKALLANKKFIQIEVYGKNRVDTPRVGSVISTNIKISFGLFCIILFYFKSCVFK